MSKNANKIAEATDAVKLDRVRQAVSCRISGQRKVLHFRSISQAFSALNMPKEMVSPMQRVRIIVKHEGVPAQIEFEGKTYTFAPE